MHEYTKEGCIRMAGLWMNRRGQIEESLTVMWKCSGGGVIVLVCQQILAKGQTMREGHQKEKTESHREGCDLGP